MRSITTHVSRLYDLGLHIARYATSRGCDPGAFPAYFLSLLPKGGQKRLLEREIYDKARLMVQCLEASCTKEDINDHVLGDYGAWLSAVQRAQAYSLDLVAPFSVLNNAIDNGAWKLRGITSREFATLASVCAKANCSDAKAILEKICDPKLLETMLPELRNSDYALFLTAMARSNMIQRLGGETVRDQCLRRIPTMDTFDIAVTVDALGRLQHSDPVIATMALERFASVMRHHSSTDRDKCPRTTRHMGNTAKLSYKSGVLEACTSSPGTKRFHLTNEIVLLLRALIRADGVDSANVGYISNIVSHINSLPDHILDEEYQKNHRSLPNWTTIVMSLCYVIAKFGNQNREHRLIDTTVIRLLNYMRCRVDRSRFSLKERTKLCLAIQTYWHLVGGSNHSKLLLDVYVNIVNPVDVTFLRDLEEQRQNHSGSTERDITSEMEECLARMVTNVERTHALERVVIPPYHVSILDRQLQSAWLTISS